MKTVDLLFQTAQRAQQTLKRHPRRVTAAIVISLLGTAVTAFGVVPMAPDAADLPRRIVTQSVTPLALDAQLSALETETPALYRSDLTRSSDTADSLLARLGIDDPDAAAFLRRDATARRLLDGKPGKMVRALATGGRLHQLVARSPAEDAAKSGTHFTRLTIERDAVGLTAKTEQALLTSEVKMGSGTIETSLFAAADESHLPDGITTQLAELFGNDIDFRRDLQRGDRFTVLYEAMTADGEPVAWTQSAGRVLAAEFVNEGKAHDAVWFQDPAIAGTKPKGGYFDLDGRSKTTAFLASPMAFSRVTSGFSMRFHPILQSWRQHLGVDFGAPTGTSVRSVGDGSVAFAGWQNGYGNVVIVEHAGGRETRYAHLSRIDARRGQHVDQGQQIGAVGATGWATGPHLHFEFRINGQNVDPMRVARSAETFVIAPAARKRFADAADAARAQFASGPAASGSRFE